VNSINNSAGRLACCTAIAAMTALLAACSGGGSVNLGSGQAADPGTVDFPVAYVKRTIPVDQDDVRAVRDTTPDADLWVRDRASPSSVERNVTERVTGTTDRYDIKDVDVSSDGKKFVFAMRGPLARNQDEKDPPAWAIWDRNTCPTAGSCFHRPASASPRPSCATRASPAMRPRPTTGAKAPSCCTS
jgi:hypothetical protein